MESLLLFDSVVNSRWFIRTSIILFLNKVDIFREKLARSPLGNYFPDYSGGLDVNKAAKYLLWRFNQVNRAHLNLYPQYVPFPPTSPAVAPCRSVFMWMLTTPFQQLDAGHGHVEHQAGLRGRQGDDIEQRATGLWYPMTETTQTPYYGAYIPFGVSCFFSYAHLILTFFLNSRILLFRP